jgi:hypothetical protein
MIVEWRAWEYVMTFKREGFKHLALGWNFVFNSAANYTLCDETTSEMLVKIRPTSHK